MSSAFAQEKGAYVPIFEQFARRAYFAIANLTWSSLLIATIVHGLLSYVLLALSGEAGLTGSFVDYVYYYMTTATTVGYGDLSPQTPAGRIWALVFVLPGSISLFTACLGKAITDLSLIWRGRMNGLGDYSLREGHTLILGWQPIRTPRLVKLLAADCPSDEKIILVAKVLEQNPLPETVDYVRADTLSTTSALSRAGISGAARVIIRGADDDETMAATLAAYSLGSKAHIVAHFEDERAAELITRQCPSVEAIGSLSVELLVRSARDPGASRVADRLLSAESEDTAFSMTVPAGIERISYLDLMLGLKRAHDMTLVGIAEDDGKTVDLNCPVDRVIKGGDVLFYIADRRVSADTVLWHTLKRELEASSPSTRDALTPSNQSDTASTDATEAEPVT
ncbi:MAG: ion channel [Pseudomonadota bacterium]